LKCVPENAESAKEKEKKIGISSSQKAELTVAARQNAAAIASKIAATIRTAQQKGFCCEMELELKENNSMKQHTVRYSRQSNSGIYQCSRTLTIISIEERTLPNVLTINELQTNKTKFLIS